MEWEKQDAQKVVRECLSPPLPSSLGPAAGPGCQGYWEGACQGPSPRDLGLGPAPSPEELQLGKVLVLRSLHALPAGTKGRWIRAGRAVQGDPRPLSRGHLHGWSFELLEIKCSGKAVVSSSGTEEKTPNNGFIVLCFCFG